jgi:fatty acid amide hydrolase 2
LEKVADKFDGMNQKHATLASELKSQLTELLKPNCIILFPSYTTTAPKHHRAILRPIDWQYTSIFNVMQLPVTQVPLGLNSEGLPLGIQVVSGYSMDHISIAVAIHLQHQFGGWSPIFTKH